jgi:hypothetical protein
MEPKPVQRASSPAYPTRRDFLAGATAFAAATFSSGLEIFAAAPGGGVLRGAGAGTAYHAEDEAFSIIREELSKAGIQLRNNVMLNDVLLPQPVNQGSAASQAPRITAGIALPQPVNKGTAASTSKPLTKSLPVSGMDQTKNIAVEYMTPSRFDNIAKELGCTNRMSNCSYQFLTIDVQQKPGSQVGDKVYLGVFRDPSESLTDAGSRGGTTPTSTRRLTAEQTNNIRQQLQVFVNWLKEQKAL